MPTAYAKYLVILLIVIGEGFAIFVEMFAAKSYSLASRPFLSLFLKMFLLICLASGFLVAGYMLGFRAFQNIWIVSVISITSILIIEPVLAYSIFRQAPTVGAIIGLIFGALGFSATLLMK